MLKRTLLVITISISIFCLKDISLAQTIQLSGQVLDEQRNPINGAEIKVDEMPYLGAVTHADGNFTLGFEEGDLGKKVRIWIRKPDHKIWSADIRISEDMNPLGSIILEKLPQAPRLISPANRDTLYDPTPEFEWESVTGCYYNLQVDDQANFLNPEINEEGLAASVYVPDTSLREETYYWRVQIKRGTDNYSEWSDPRIVRIIDISPIKGSRNRKAALRSLAVPGWGQRYKGRSGKWWGISYGLSIGGAVAAHLIYDWQYNKYLESRSIEELEDAYDLANWSRKIRNGLFIVIPAIAISSAIHAYSSEDARIREEIHTGIEYDLYIRKGQIQLVFTKSF